VSKKIRLFSVALVVFVVVLMVFAGTALASYNMTTHTKDHSAVIGSVHDVTRADPTANPCDNCHIPHGAKGSFLFSRAPKAITVTAGSTSDLEPLCYSCHDGQIASVGLTTVFSTTHENHRTTAASTLGSTGAATGPGKDCDRCHDPHDDGNTKFLIYERYSSKTKLYTTFVTGGNVCANCHSGNVDPSSGGASTNGMNHKTNIVPSAASVPTDGIWGMTSSGPDYSGTRLFDPTTHLVMLPDNPNYATAQVHCETCHSPHGADNDTLNTMSTSDSALCLNCHK
jgi:predicted CXXCH cytochrome family protein